MVNYKWFLMLPENLRPDKNDTVRIQVLEALRISFSLDDLVFSEIIVGSDWATIHLQRKLFEDGKKLKPELSDKQLFKEILMSRTSSRIPMGLDLNEEDVDEFVNQCNTIEELVEFIMKKEREIDGPDIDHMRENMNAQIMQIMEQDTPPKIKIDLFTRLINCLKVWKGFFKIIFRGRV